MSDTAAIADRISQARAWLRQDPDPHTRDELAALITAAGSGSASAIAELDDRFGSRLEFGTAGLRGEIAAGSNRMNRVLVAQAASGLATFLTARASGNVTVVIGFDGRRNSRVFAEDSAEIFAGAGIRAILLPRLLPTPVLAFAVRYFAADAGVMVTASHNPPGDNGYKVYLGGSDDGAQIVSPSDAEIAAEIVRAAAGDVREIPRSTDYETAGDEVVDAYVDATAAVARSEGSDFRWVYTAMHGVGGETLLNVMQKAGFPSPIVVEAQQQPDARFPTVAFPNPEEPGALDLAITQAQEAGASLVVANDPDADRLAIAIPQTDGSWRRLSGNEVGLLLGVRAARAAAGQEDASLASSLVSSPGLGVIAARHGLRFVETLTGFKWISRAPGLVFGFEEALGYLVNPDTVRDKDGISAAVAVLGLADHAITQGKTLDDLLTEVGDHYGHFASAQISIRVDDLSIITRIMAALRADPPTVFGDYVVVDAEDLQQPGGTLPPGNVLRYRLGDNSRIIVRPSGTEPKLKVYLDTAADSADGATARVGELEASVRELLAALS